MTRGFYRIAAVAALALVCSSASAQFTTPTSLYGSIPTPLAIPGCEVWLRSDLGITSSSGNLTAWANQGSVGSAGNASGTGTYPAYASSGGLNGRGKVTFAAGDFLTWSYTTSGPAKTVCYVAKLTTLAHTGMTAYVIDNAGVYTEEILDLSGYQNVSFQDNNGGNVLVGSSPTLDTTAGHLFCHTYNGGSPASTPGFYTQTYNGAAQTVVSSGAYGGTGTSAIGGRSNGVFALTAEMDEIMVFNRVLSAAELLLIYNYDHAFFGI